jgi:HD-GYP domain-containing protein (c-di-GMP phosphodiesterase class II)
MQLRPVEGSGVASSEAPRRIEILAALSLAIDLGLGQPMEHMLRSALIGLRLCDLLGLDEAARQRVFYTNLLAWIGCHADSFELAALFGDDIGFRRAYYSIDARGLPLLGLLLRRTGAERDAPRRAIARSRFLLVARSVMLTTIRSHCASAAKLADRVGLDDGLSPILGYTFERWDGHGMPNGSLADQIPLEMRVAHVADLGEIALRTGTAEHAAAGIRARSGTQFDPEVAELFCGHADEFVTELDSFDLWSRAVDQGGDDRRLSGQALDAVLTAIGDFADLKSPYTAGHSRAVSDLACRAAGVWCPADAQALRRAGWLHDLGRLGVSNSIWDKLGPLTELERERMRAHPYLTERIVTRIPGLQRESQLAGAHHERIDGSGYPRGTGSSLDSGQRLLAVADAYQSSLEPRPHRAALSPAEAAARIAAACRDRCLDRRAADAVLEVAGHEPLSGHDLPAGLTAREAQVLALICRGLSDREIAERLVIAPKTARNHVEHIYIKIDARNRVGATLFAMEHNLLTASSATDGPSAS